MKKFLSYCIIIVGLFNFSMKLDAQSADRNYVLTHTALDSTGRMSATVQYCDGMGRPVVSVSDGMSGSGRHTAIRQEYDMLGRKTLTWLPVATGSADYILPDGNAEQEQYGDEIGFTHTSYDALSRPTEAVGPGRAWWSGSHAARTIYGTNGKDDVKLYKAPCDGKNHLVKAGYYPPCSLYLTTSIDEDGHTLSVYTDKQGQEVLERRRDGSLNNDTYFVYNDLGQLRFVLSPRYQEAGYKELYAYEYRYDGRGNVVKKFLPGCGYTQYWYDSADRLVFMQDAEMRGKGIFRFMLYDIFGRLAVQGVASGKGGFSNGTYMPVVVFDKNGSGILGTGYSRASGFNLPAARLEKTCYYDGYDFLYGGPGKFFNSVTHKPDSRATGKQTGAVESASNGGYVSEVYTYDDKGRMTGTVRTGLDGASLETSLSLSFTDKPTESLYNVKLGDVRTFHFRRNTEYNQYNDMPEKEMLSIDIDGKPLISKHEIAENTYDDLGRLVAVSRPGNAGNVSYDYNLRGWTTAITTPTFTEKLYYADDDGYSTPCYNGNISSQRWTNGNFSNPRWYRFTYDDLNRLTWAKYSERDDHGHALNRFDEKILEYDANGNIERLQRHGRKQDGFYGKIDNLHISHNGNQLSYVEDDAAGLYYEGAFDFRGSRADYKYNSVGSLTEDTGRGIALIEYGDWNNPRRIQFSNGNVTKYVYSADGEKLRTIHYTAAPNITVEQGQTHELSANEILSVDSTDYIGNLILMNGQPDMYLFPGGYYSFGQNSDAAGNTSEYGFLYYNSDHLGNVREVVNEDGELLQVNNYYPFGVPFSDDTISAKNPGLQPYKYTTKEFDLIHGLNTYDHGARQNYSILGVWDRIDPLAEKYYNISPYVVCANKPIKIIDQNGKELGDWEEFLFVLRHPIAASRIGSYQRGSNNISTNSVRFATRAEILYGSKKNEDDRGSENGAFRHVLWQATITSIFGWTIAKEAGDAHEDNPNINMSKSFFTSLDDADKSVDLHNNIIGRRIGIGSNGEGMKDLAITVLNDFKNSGFYEAQKVQGGYKIVKRKIDGNKYKKLLQIFRRLNNNGRYEQEEIDYNIKQIQEATKYVH